MGGGDGGGGKRLHVARRGANWHNGTSVTVARSVGRSGVGLGDARTGRWTT
jgi:hypothetical protein